MALPHYTGPYFTLPQLYLGPLDSAIPYYNSTYLSWTLLDSITIMAVLGSTSRYYPVLYHASNWLYLILLNSTTLYHSSNLFYLTLLDSTMALLSSTGLYLTLLYSAMALPDSTSLYLTLLHSTMPLIGST